MLMKSPLLVRALTVAIALAFTSNAKAAGIYPQHAPTFEVISNTYLDGASDWSRHYYALEFVAGLRRTLQPNIAVLEARGLPNLKSAFEQTSSACKSTEDELIAKIQVARSRFVAALAKSRKRR